MGETKKPTIPQVLPLVRAHYAKEGNYVGGIFHVMLEDGNWEKTFAESALENAQARGDPDEILLASLLIRMSGTQRKKLASLRHYPDRIRD